MTNTDQNIQQHLWNVLGYLWEDEQRSYEGRTPDGTDPHIFESLIILERWLREQSQATK